MRLSAGNPDRLQRIGFVERLGEPAGLARPPIDGLIGDLFELGIGDGKRDGAWSNRAGDARRRTARRGRWRDSAADRTAEVAPTASTHASRVAASFAIPDEAAKGDSDRRLAACR